MVPTEAGLLYWYTSSAILGILTILNLSSKIYRRHVRRRSTQEKDSVAYDTEKLSPAVGRRSRRGISRWVDTFQTGWTRYVILADLPFPTPPWVRHMRYVAGTELGWTVGYTVGVMVLSFYGTAWDIKAWANQTGWIAIAQIPMIIALAGKNNIVFLLTGISYERLNFLHRAAGRVCLLGAWIHTVGYIYLLGGISLIQFQTSLTTWGMTSILGLSLMYVSSVRAVRQRIYEFFIIAHICLAALFLGGVIMHWRAVDVWIYPGIGLWASDRLLRLARLFLPSFLSFTSITPPPSTKGTISLLTPSTLKLTLPTNTTWSAGQHFYVNLPGLSRFPWETHPFTAATIPTGHIEGEVSFIIRVREGMTGRMKAQIDRQEGGEVQIDGRVEGPYGSKKDLRGKDAVIIFAGGSGISFAVAHLLQIIADAKAGKTSCRSVQIVWMVKSKLHLNWIEPLLLPALTSLPPSLRITLHIHLTKRSSLPNPQSALPQNPAENDGDWQMYMEERAAQPRRTSRLMSTMSWATFGGRNEAGDMTAPGTRRGSEAVQSWRSREGSTRPESQTTLVKQAITDEAPGESGVVLPTLMWTDGYGGTDIPSEFGAYASVESSSGPIGPVNRARFQSYDSARSDAYLDPATSITPPPRSRQPSFDPIYASQINDDNLPHARTRKVSFVDTLPSPKRTQFSFDSTNGQGRRASDPALFAAETRKPSTGYSVIRKSSLAIITTSYDDPLSLDSPAELEITLPTPSATHINFSRPFPVGPISTLQIPPTSAQMSRSSTGDSMASFSSGHQLVPGHSGLGIGSPGSHTPISNSPFPLSSLPHSSNQHHTTSPLDELVKWHEGRADPADIIRQTKEELGRGNLEVMVCGPASLLVAVKKASKGEMGIKEFWRGGVKIGFHAESFGW